MKFDYSLLPLLKGKGKGIVVTLLNDINNLGDKKLCLKNRKIAIVVTVIRTT